MSSLKTLCFVFALVLGAAACAGENACTGFACEEGFSCLIQDGTPTCVPDGINGGGDGTGQLGDECDTNNDCESPLVCEANLNGTLVCSD